MMHQVDLSSASNGFHFPELVKKKKKKKRKEDLNEQGDDQPVRTSLCSPPSSEHSSIFSWFVEDSEATGVCGEKTKNIKAGKEIPDSQSDATWIPTDSELNSKTGTDTPVRKKKKRKHQPSEQEDGSDYCIPETPEKPSSLHPMLPLMEHLDLSLQEKKQMAHSDITAEFSSPISQKRKKRKKVETPSEASDLENAGCATESTPVQKKKANKTDCSDTEDTQKDIFEPSPPSIFLTQHSELSQEERKEANQSHETAELCSPIARKKKKRKKAETSEEASSHLEASHLDNAGLHKHSTTNCSDTADMKEDLFADLPPVPLTQPSDFSQEENSVVNELDSTVKFSSPVTRKKSHKRKNAPSTNYSDPAKVDLAVEETVKSVAEPEQPQQLGSPLQLPTLGGDDGPQKSPTSVHSDAEESSSSKFSLVDNEFAEFSQLALKDLDSATKELEEFIPHIRTLSDSAIKQLAGRDLVRFRNFKKKGIKVRFGKFSRKENDQLRQNIEAFLKDTGIESPEKLLFSHRFPQEKESINKLKTINLFGAKIAQGIPRPWRLVYYRARKMYDPKNYNGRYSEKEKKKLKKYQALYGNNWKKISDLMCRSSHSVESKFSEIKCAFNSGPWSSEETRELVQVIKETLLTKMRGSDPGSEKEDEDGALTITYENLCKGISWSQVEAKVGTRHWRQCKHKWISIVTKKIMGKRTRRSRLEHLRINIALIERLYEVDADDIEEVDWEEIASAIGNVPPYYIRSRFYKIKAKHVPHWNNRSFMEIITHLYEVVLPMLKKQLTELMARKNITEVPQQSEDYSWKKVFKFSDFFHDSDYISEDDSEDDQGN